MCHLFSLHFFNPGHGRAVEVERMFFSKMMLENFDGEQRLHRENFKQNCGEKWMEDNDQPLTTDPE